MTVQELISKRAQAWEAAKAFLDAHRGEDGLLSAEDSETYDPHGKGHHGLHERNRPSEPPEGHRRPAGAADGSTFDRKTRRRPHSRSGSERAVLLTPTQRR
jgi:hypothetical protein